MKREKFRSKKEAEGQSMGQDAPISGPDNLEDPLLLTEEAISQARATTFLSMRTKGAIALALAVGGLAWLIYFMFTGATIELKTVASVIEAQPVEQGGKVGMRGKLVPGSFIREPDGIAAQFLMKDEGGYTSIPVRYLGDFPSTIFNDHSEITVHGHKDEAGLFHAESMQVKCPSKYQTLSDEGDYAPYEGSNVAS